MNTQWFELDGESFRDPFYCVLGRAVQTKTGGRILITKKRRDVDDVSRTLVAEVRQHGSGDIEQSKYIGIILFSYFFGRGFFCRCQQTIAGIVHKDIDTSKTLDGGGYACFYFFLAGDVERDDQDPVFIAETGG